MHQRKNPKLNTVSDASIKNRRFALALVSPAFIYLIAVMGMPLLWAIYVSFTDKTIGSGYSFIGLQNYAELLEDDVFIKSLCNTFIYAGIAVSCKVFFGVIMAVLLNQSLKFRGIFRVAMILPWTITTTVSVFAWQWLYSDIGGALNQILKVLHITNQPVGWLSTPKMAMFSVIVVNVWRGTPFIGISVLAGLQNISHDLYEAAELDGAGVLRRFFSITLPLVKDVVLLSTLVTTIWTLNDFEIVWLMTRGGPSNGTQLISTYSYTQGFLNMNISKSVAAALILLPLLIVFVQMVSKISLKNDTD